MTDSLILLHVWETVLDGAREKLFKAAKGGMEHQPNTYKTKHLVIVFKVFSKVKPKAQWKGIFSKKHSPLYSLSRFVFLCGVGLFLAPLWPTGDKKTLQ